MTGFLDELQAAVTAAAERVGPAVIGLGRGWGRGSGVVIADGRVITNAHVLRGEEVAVKRPDGEYALGRVAGLDADLDVAVIDVDTAGAPAVAWEPDDPRGRPARAARVRARRPGRPRPAHDVRPGHRDRPLVPRARAGAASAARSSTRRRCRAAPRAARWSTPRAGCSGSTRCAWRAAWCWRCRRTPPCAPGSTRSGAARRRRGRGSARRSRPPRAARKLRAAVGLPERDGLLVRAVEADSPADARRPAARRPARRRGRAARCTGSTSCSRRSTPPGTRWR